MAVAAFFEVRPYQYQILSTDDIVAMLGESLTHHIEANLDNAENNNSTTASSHSPGTNIIKTRQTLFKKGTRRVRSTAFNPQNNPQRSQQKHGLLRINNSARLADINNNTVMRPKSPVQLSTETTTNKSQGSVSSHQLKVGLKKELLKSRSGRPERSSQLGNQTISTANKCDQTPLNVSSRGQKSRCSIAAAKTSVKKSDNSYRQRPPFTCKEPKKPFTLADNVSFVNLCQSEFGPEENLKDGEKVYAGAKFSEPPSPSVLPKPPSHWVGENKPPRASDGREQMTSHLKSLLKVSDRP